MTALLAVTARADSRELTGGRNGLRDYLDRRDRAAMRVLQDELAAGAADPRVALAISDIAFIEGDYSGARRALEIAAALAPEPAATQARIWISWVDFRIRAYGAAEDGLRRLIDRDASSDATDEARFTLGWQQLLAGRYHDAALTFRALPAVRGTHWLAYPDHTLLLEGEASLWDGDLDGAEQALGRLSRDYPSSPVADDALRDLAWCAHLRGDDAGARRALRAIVDGYENLHFASDGLPVPWSTVVAEGPRVLTRSLWRTYRRRPRGEPPLHFLLRIGNRDAAADARDLLGMLDARAAASGAAFPPLSAAAVHEPSRPHEGAVGIRAKPFSGRDAAEPAPQPCARLAGGILSVLLGYLAMKLARRRRET